MLSVCKDWDTMREREKPVQKHKKRKITADANCQLSWRILELAVRGKTTHEDFHKRQYLAVKIPNLLKYNTYCVASIQNF